MRTPLTAEQLEEALHALPQWSGDRQRISRTVPHVDDATLARIAAVADELDHHPVVEHVEGGVRLVLWTHVCGAVTELDVSLATRLDALL